MRKFILASLLLTSSCSFMSEPKEPIKKFVIQSENKLPQHKNKISLSLYIQTDIPTLRPYIKLSPHRIEPLAYAEWNEDLKQMIEKSIIQSFQDAGIEMHNQGNTYSQKHIKIFVRHFGLEYRPSKKILHVSYFTEIYDMPSYTLKKQKLFEIQEKHMWTSDDNYIQSLNQAHNKIVAEIHQWIQRS